MQQLIPIENSRKEIPNGAFSGEKVLIVGNDEQFYIGKPCDKFIFQPDLLSDRLPSFSDDQIGHSCELYIIRDCLYDVFAVFDDHVAAHIAHERHVAFQVGRCLVAQRAARFDIHRRKFTVIRLRGTRGYPNIFLRRRGGAD